MRLNWILLPLVLSVAATGARAEDNPERGAQLYATCAACHGVLGEGNRDLNAPRLTHLAPVYIVAQLQKFKAGIRGGGEGSDSGDGAGEQREAGPGGHGHGGCPNRYGAPC